MIKRIALIAAVLLYASGASAQYPNKPVRIVIPFGPGSSTDAIMRILATPLSAALGQQVIIDPKPGGDGAISAIEVARAAPDGYTLGVGSGSPLAAVPALRKNPPYNPVADFTPITDIGRYTVFLYVNASVPANTFQEFVAYVKANPGKLAYGTGNASGIVAFAQMNTMLGLDMLHVPYKSAPPAVLDLVGNRVQVMMDPPTAALAFVKEGKLRALATTLRSRSPLLPDVPTIYEAGLPQFTISNWMGLVGPANLPRDIVERINREFAAALKRPEVLAALERQAFIANPSSPEQFAAFIKEQMESYGRLLRAAGVQPD
jgi:tripartite-type tricarboxylate transporter receptor subunit TctC